LAIEESSLEDASRATGRTKTALKVNLHRAVAALRLRLGVEPAKEPSAAHDPEEPK
jgi:DNA-directed RNA polymerase specialized sigma24 family protein